jgi:amino acid transporter
MATASNETVSLRRTLRFRDLVLYGIILIQPTAPMPVFGVLYKESHGHVVLTILLALVAMLFTAISYGRMARVYPHGGSAFLYVGKEIHPSMGYLTGWCLVLDYVLNPLICIIWASSAAMNFVPGSPFIAWALFFALLFTWLNSNGVETSARINAGMAAILGVVIVLVLIGSVRWIFLMAHPTAGAFWDPIFNRASFSSSGLLRGTSIAVLTYIGFDGISTLTDEAREPSRDVPRAIVFTCLVTGILAAIEVYFAQLVWPRGLEFPDLNTAYVHVSGRIGGPVLFAIVNGALLVATIGSGMASHLGAARLLYVMGNDGALPRRFFAAVNKKRQIPLNNVLLIGIICLAGALGFSHGGRNPDAAYQLGAEMLNFGALLAFVGVNLSSILRGWREGARQHWLAMLASALGAITCSFLWWNLSPVARIAGSIWATLGVLLWLVRRRHTALPNEAA